MVTVAKHRLHWRPNRAFLFSIYAHNPRGEAPFSGNLPLQQMERKKEKIFIFLFSFLSEKRRQRLLAFSIYNKQHILFFLGSSGETSSSVSVLFGYSCRFSSSTAFSGGSLSFSGSRTSLFPVSARELAF